MEPVSGAFLFLVCGVALACVVAAVMLWPRLAGSGTKTLVSRTGVLIATQALLTAAIVLITNKYFVFYATWNDLFGSDVAKVKVNQVQPTGGGRAGPAELVRRTTTDLAPEHRGREQGPAKDGRVDHLEIRGPRSGIDTEAYVYLPPQYFQPAYAGKRLPVIVLLSGGPSAMAWIKQARLPATADKAAGDRTAQPMVYVMVGAPRGCVDTPGRRGGLPETFLAQDLPPALASTYRLPFTRKGWGLAGLGEGGRCAARLAMLHSDRFATAASMGGRFDPPGPPAKSEPPAGTGEPTLPAGDAPPPASDSPLEAGNPKKHKKHHKPRHYGLPGAKGDPYGGSAVYRQDNDLLWRLEHLPPPPVAVLATTPAGGEEQRQADRLVALTRPPMWASRTIIPAQLRTLADWRPYLPQVLQWLSAHLRAE
ncbi:alpha/beta hydrolase [Actinomadura terrae]|uniref:alpha/beta hydrolase n=1 Tax=Actinomadura terrae TaxID=604353 RepID=UPI001FA6D186|nr:alpha/beta hydrolase-fold protein [Actinomadura terrae]